MSQDDIKNLRDFKRINSRMENLSEMSLKKSKVITSVDAFKSKHKLEKID